VKWAVLSWITLSAGQALAQHEARFWYFGNMGLDFAQQPPLRLYNTPMRQLEGSGTISSPLGELLFYSDGMSLWNRFHQVTPNGTGLLGHWSSTQAALFIPKPGNPDIFYLFTTDVGTYEDTNIEGLRYSVVSLCEDQGRGDILATTKNRLLVKPTAEKVTATYHANGTDVWVVTHPLNTDEFFAYLVTENGVNHTPVRSRAGAIYLNAEGNVAGQMKFSPDGRRLAMGTYNEDPEAPGGMGSVRVFNFNNSTGVVTDVGYKAWVNSVYPVEFSADGKMVYAGITFNRMLVQMEVEKMAGEPVDFLTTIHMMTSNGQFSNFQLAPDGKIYTNNLSTINRPNEKGLACEYVHQDPEMGTTLGLSNFIQNYFDPKPLIVHTQPCDGQFQFSLTRSEQVQTVQWSFGDPASGARNSSAEAAPGHEFTAEGIFQVTATITLLSGEVLTRQKKVIWKPFEVDLGADRVLCDRASFPLDATQNDYACYRWQDGSTLPTYTATRTGWYWVDVRLGGCTKRDSIFLEFFTTPVMNLGPDRILCEGRTITLPSNTDAASLLWSTGSTGNMIMVSQPGTYWLRAANGPCKTTDSVTVRLQLLPKLELPPDTTFCKGTSLYLDVRQPGALYQWSTGHTGGDITLLQEGKYWVRATINGCPATDTVRVAEIRPVEQLQQDTLICEGRAITLDFTRPETSYQWSTGSTQPVGELSVPGLYTIAITNRCYQQEVSVGLATENCDCLVQVPNVFTPNEDGRNDSFKPIWHQEVKEIDFRIVNRWGTEVFSTRDKESSWRGSGGSEAPLEGVYFWTARYSCHLGGEIQQRESKGTVTVVR